MMEFCMFESQHEWPHSGAFFQIGWKGLSPASDGDCPKIIVKVFLPALDDGAHYARPLRPDLRFGSRSPFFLALQSDLGILVRRGDSFYRVFELSYAIPPAAILDTAWDQALKEVRSQLQRLEDMLAVRKDLQTSMKAFEAGVSAGRGLTKVEE